MLSQAQLLFHGDLQHGIRGCTEKNQKKKKKGVQKPWQQRRQNGTNLEKGGGKQCDPSIAPMPSIQGQDRANKTGSVTERRELLKKRDDL